MSHFGRGGAGNKMSKAEIEKSPSLGPQTTTTPILTSKNYTTGRGGQGNIVSNDSAETARLAQDVDVPGIALPENNVHTGRGGAGNTRYLTEEERKTAQDHNKNLRSASFSKDKGFLKNLGDKAKELVKGDKNEGSAVN